MSVQIINQLKNPEVRNLAWCLLSPSLISQSDTTMAVYSLPYPVKLALWLQQLDDNPLPLMQWMAECNSTRIGLIFEHYWHFYWHNIDAISGDTADKTPTHEFRHNVQIHRHGKTVGELDAVHYSGDDRQVHHQELAVKFYLGITPQLAPNYPFPTINSTTNNQVLPVNEEDNQEKFLWLGPNANDRLDIKLSQLEHKQLRRLDDQKHWQVLPKHWCFDRVVSSLIIKGRLFYPLGYQQSTAISNEYRPETGTWMTLAQLNNGGLEQLQQRDTDLCHQYQILSREQWFAPIHWADCDTAMTPVQLIDQAKVYFTHEQRPFLVAVMPAADENEQPWAQPEIERFFVVHNNWPDICLA